jgi:histone-binding protein RBBP4
LTTYSKGNKLLKPSRTYTHHSSIVNDVQYHPLHSSLIGTVSDDITLQILDIRESETTRAAASAEGQHRDAINAIAFNPAAETVLATGSADKTIGLWDLRNLKTKLHSLESHTDSVTSISWHPFEEAVLASASYDRKIAFWDLSRAGEEQTPEDAQDGPPELYVDLAFFSLSVYLVLIYLCRLFQHGGHTNRISDFSWNLNDPWVLCSAAEDNLLQVWKVADAIVGKDLEDVPTEELEP